MNKINNRYKKHFFLNKIIEGLLSSGKIIKKTIYDQQYEIIHTIVNQTISEKLQSLDIPSRETIEEIVKQTVISDTNSKDDNKQNADSNKKDNIMIAIKFELFVIFLLIIDLFFNGHFHSIWSLEVPYLSMSVNITILAIIGIYTIISFETFIYKPLKFKDKYNDLFEINDNAQYSVKMFLVLFFAVSFSLSLIIFPILDLRSPNTLYYSALFPNDLQKIFLRPFDILVVYLGFTLLFFMIYCAIAIKNHKIENVFWSIFKYIIWFTFFPYILLHIFYLKLAKESELSTIGTYYFLLFIGSVLGLFFGILAFFMFCKMIIIQNISNKDYQKDLIVNFWIFITYLSIRVINYFLLNFIIKWENKKLSKEKVDLKIQLVHKEYRLFGLYIMIIINILVLFIPYKLETLTTIISIFALYETIRDRKKEIIEFEKIKNKNSGFK